MFNKLSNLKYQITEIESNLANDLCEFLSDDAGNYIVKIADLPRTINITNTNNSDYFVGFHIKDSENNLWVVNLNLDTQTITKKFGVLSEISKWVEQKIKG